MRRKMPVRNECNFMWANVTVSSGLWIHEMLTLEEKAGPKQWTVTDPKSRRRIYEFARKVDARNYTMLIEASGVKPANTDEFKAQHEAAIIIIEGI